MSRSEAVKLQIEQAQHHADNERKKESVPEITSTSEKTEGTQGTGGTASNDAASSCSPLENSQGTEGTLRRPSFGIYPEKVLRDGRTFGSGVWHHAVDKNGDPVDRYICSPLIVEAVTSNDGEDFGRLVRFTDTFGNWREWALPMAMLAGPGEQMRAEFLSRGAYIAPDAHKLFNSYLMMQAPKRRMVAATATGWHSSELFIMPRRNIGEGEAIYQNESYHADDYSEGGSLDEWKATIGRWCQGNPLLMLGVCAALSGPLLKPLMRQGAGFHAEGDSSTGKSTVMNAGASVWGEPEQYIRTWRGTSNGFEGVASQRNDTALVLDEIGQATGREVGNIVYTLANGTGKARANRSGGERKAKRWRVMVLSSGELSLERHMQESGQRARAGQEIRLLSVSARRRYGAWDNLHGFKDGRELSDAIQRAAGDYYGHAGPEFVKRLIESGEAGNLPDMLASLLHKFDSSTGQEARAAERFAIVALAGEMAILFDLLPIESGEPTDAMVKLFTAWKEKRGSGQSEDTKILQSIRDFIARHGDNRFSDIEDTAPKIHGERAGWWKDINGERIFMFTSTGLGDAVPGYDMRRITDALVREDWITEHDAEKRAKKVRAGGKAQWLYHIREVEQ